MFSDAAARDDSFASAASFGQASAVSAKSFQSAKSGNRVSSSPLLLLAETVPEILSSLYTLAVSRMSVTLQKRGMCNVLVAHVLADCFMNWSIATQQSRLLPSPAAVLIASNLVFNVLVEPRCKGPVLSFPPLQDWSRAPSVDSQLPARSRTPSPLRYSTNPLLGEGDTTAYNTPLGVTPRDDDDSPPRTPPTRYV